LLTNEEVIAVDQTSSAGRQLFNHDRLIGWVADVPGSADKYVALFNARDRSLPGAGSDRPGLPVVLQWADLGFKGPCRVRALWQKKDLGEFVGKFAPVIAWHGAGLFRISPPANE
jgi:hypothetical protein